MLTKYGNTLTEEMVNQYLDRLVGKIFKLLPLFESDKESFQINHRTLMQEITASEALILYCGFYIELINKLECLSTLDEHKYVKKHIRECIDIVTKLKQKVGDWAIGENS